MNPNNPATAINWSLNMNMGVCLRNLQGATPPLGDSMRRLAYRTARRNHLFRKKPLKVLEVTLGVPFNGIELINTRSFRDNYGDYLQYYVGSRDLDDVRAGNYPGGNHDIATGFKTPQVSLTVVSPRDHLQDILQGELPGVDDHTENFVRTRMNSILEVYRNARGAGSIVTPELLAAKYRELKETSMLRVIEGNVVDSLDALPEREFDLAFCTHHMFTPDRAGLFGALQRRLNEGGVGYAPVASWSPPGPDDKGIKEGWLIRDVIESGEFLETYLSMIAPDAFEEIYFPGAKTLLLKGTESDAQIPHLSSESTGYTVRTCGGNPPDYFPDTPVLRWREC